MDEDDWESKHPRLMAKVNSTSRNFRTRPVEARLSPHPMYSQAAKVAICTRSERSVSWIAWKEDQND